MNRDEILKTNKCYWDTYADLWFGTTALPTYGVHFVTEDELQLFGDVSGKKMLELCCGSGHSLKYHADRNASELWGVDLSHKQIENARRYLSENGYTANFICSPMEADMDIPKNYFDYIYSIYGIGWTTDLDGTFQKISSYLKKDGIFIFSWHHPLNYCIAWGIVCELYLSHTKVGFPKEKMRQTIRFIKDNYGVFTFDCKKYEQLYAFMTHDKKNTSGTINFTLLKDIGDICINQTADKDTIFEMLDFYRECMGI